MKLAQLHSIFAPYNLLRTKYLFADGTDVVEVAHIDFDDVQSSPCRLLQIDQRGRLVRSAARRHDEVRRGLDELSNKFQANAARSPGDARTILVSLYE